MTTHEPFAAPGKPGDDARREAQQRRDGPKDAWPTTMDLDDAQDYLEQVLHYNPDRATDADDQYLKHLAELLAEGVYGSALCKRLWRHRKHDPYYW